MVIGAFTMGTVMAQGTEKKCEKAKTEKCEKKCDKKKECTKDKKTCDKK